jgi:membrane fusion protein
MRMSSSTAASGQPAWEEQAPLIRQEPPHWFAPALAWLLIALFAVALLAAIFVRIPETVQSRFVLLQEGGADPIQSPRPAVIEQVLVRAGQQVKKGDRLFLLRVDQVREWRTEMDTRQEALRALGDRSAKLEEQYGSSLRIKDGEIDQAEREVAFRIKHVEIMRDLLSRVEKLSRSGLMSDIELASHRLDLAQSEKDLEVARKTLAQRHLERRRIETDRKQQRIEEKAAADDLAIRISALRQPLSTSANGLLEIRAPYDGVCVRVTQENAGSVVAAGEQLCQVSPLSSRLQARLDVPESGLSLLKAQQHVRLLFDAFPYQRFGVVSGSIEWISPAAVAREQGSEFVALASLDRKQIVAGGNAYALKPGMRGQARITVGRRALIEYAIEPLHKLHENLAP